MDKKTEQPKKTKEEQAKDFIKKYEALCKDTGFQIVVTPAYKVSQDTGTFSTVLQSSVGALPNTKE